MDTGEHASRTGARGGAMALGVLVATTALAVDARSARAQDAGTIAAGGSAGGVVFDVATRSDRGRVRCILFAGADGYPTRPERARTATGADIHARHATCVFDAAPGEYALAAYHDENGNNRLDTGIFGIPVEGMAASNDARGSFGPPSYASARFVHRGPGTTALRVTIRY